METAANKEINDDIGMLEKSPKVVECLIERTGKKTLDEKKEKAVNPAVEENDFLELLTKDIDREVAELRDYLEGPDVEEATSEMIPMPPKTHIPRQEFICHGVETNHSGVSFSSYINETKKYLKVEKMTPYAQRAFTEHRMTYPLGIVFDEIQKCWWICDRVDKVFRIQSDGRHEIDAISTVTHELLRNPSAVAVYKEGLSIAVLCSEASGRNYWISIIEYAEKSSKPFITQYCSYQQRHMDLVYECRGLAKSMSSRNLITMDFPPRRLPRLRVIDAKNSKEASCSLQSTIKPSFIASAKDLVVITDLGSNTMVLLRVDDSKWEDCNICKISILAMLKSSGIPRSLEELADTNSFNFVAGVQIDENGFILVGDAGGNSLKLFDRELRFMHRVSTETAIPYMSSFFVNKMGEILLIDIHGQNKLSMGQLGGIERQLPWIAGFNSKRAGVQSRFNKRPYPPVKHQHPLKKQLN